MGRNRKVLLWAKKFDLINKEVDCETEVPIRIPSWAEIIAERNERRKQDVAQRVLIEGKIRQAMSTGEL